MVPFKHYAMLGAALAVLGTGSAQASIAYDNAAVAPTQGFQASVGLDFTVNAPISVSSLGVFDGGSVANLAGANGKSGVTVAIFNIATGLQVGSAVTFTVATPGLQTNGDAFQSVTPFILSVGNYSVVAANDFIYNSFGAINATSTTNTGGGAIGFIGTGRFSTTPGLSFPTNNDGGPANRYDAGTFQFSPVAAVTEPAAVLLLGSALLGFGLTRRRMR